MASEKTLTSANSIFTILAAGIFPIPQTLSGYAVDKAFAADALQRLAADPAGRRAMGAAARSLGEKEFARTLLAERFVATLTAHAH